MAGNALSCSITIMLTNKKLIQYFKNNFPSETLHSAGKEKWLPRALSVQLKPGRWMELHKWRKHPTRNWIVCVHKQPFLWERWQGGGGLACQSPQGEPRCCSQLWESRRGQGVRPTLEPRSTGTGLSGPPHSLPADDHLHITYVHSTWLVV